MEIGARLGLALVRVPFDRGDRGRIGLNHARSVAAGGRASRACQCGRVVAWHPQHPTHSSSSPARPTAVGDDWMRASLRSFVCRPEVGRKPSTLTTKQLTQPTIHTWHDPGRTPPAAPRWPGRLEQQAAATDAVRDRRSRRVSERRALTHYKQQQARHNGGLLGEPAEALLQVLQDMDPRQQDRHQGICLPVD